MVYVFLFLIPILLTLKKKKKMRDKNHKIVKYTKLNTHYKIKSKKNKKKKKITAKFPLGKILHFTFLFFFFLGLCVFSC